MPVGNKIKVLQTVKGAYSSAFRSFLPALGISASVISTAVIVLTGLLYFIPTTPAVVYSYLAAFFLMMFWAFSSSAYLSLSRTIGTDVSLRPWVLLRTLRYWKFVGSTFTLAATVLSTLFLVFGGIYIGWGKILGVTADGSTQQEMAVLMGVGFVGGVAMAGIVTLRMFLLLPEVAATGKFSPTMSWKRTRGGIGTIWLSYFLATAPLGFLQSLVNYLGFGNHDVPTQAFVTGFAIVIAFIQSLVMGGISGMAYKQVVLNDGGTRAV